MITNIKKPKKKKYKFTNQFKESKIFKTIQLQKKTKIGQHSFVQLDADVVNTTETKKIMRDFSNLQPAIMHHATIQTERGEF